MALFLNLPEGVRLAFAFAFVFNFVVLRIMNVVATPYLRFFSFSYDKTGKIS